MEESASRLSQWNREGKDNMALGATATNNSPNKRSRCKRTSDVCQNKAMKITADCDDETTRRFEKKQDPFSELLANTSHGVVSTSLSYLDVVSIVQKKRVNTIWRDLGERAIDSKAGRGKTKKRSFLDNKELKNAVSKYVDGDCEDTEAIAETYGYPIGKWDVSRVKDFSSCFYYKEGFNEDIRSWNVASATNMEKMFYGAETFNQNLAGWDVSSVVSMREMFAQAYRFDGSVSDWDTSNVIDMSRMFHAADSFRGTTVSNWDTSSVTTMRGMFSYTKSFRGCNISTWNVSRVTDMCLMFSKALEFRGDLSAWNVSKECKLYLMFFGAPKCNPRTLPWYYDSNCHLEESLFFKG